MAHPNVNPSDLNENGLLLSQNQIERSKAIQDDMLAIEHEAQDVRKRLRNHR